MSVPFTRIPFSAPNVSYPPEDLPTEADKTTYNCPGPLQRARAVSRLTQTDASRDAVRRPVTAVRQTAVHSSTPELYSSEAGWSSTGEWSSLGPHGIDSIVPDLYTSQPTSSSFHLPSHRLPARATCWSAPPKKNPQDSRPDSQSHPQSARPRQHTARLSARSVRSSTEGRPHAPLSAVPSRSKWKHDPAGWQSVRPETKRVQSAYENHKDEIVWDGDRNSHVISTEDKLLSSQGAGEFVPTAAATFTSTGIQTESVVPPEAPVQAALSTTRDWECVVEQLQAKFVGNAEEARIRTPSLWQHHASTPSAEEFCQRAEDLVQGFHTAQGNVAMILNGERELEPNPSDTCRNAVPIMKGLMSPAILVHRHHLTIDQVAHLYDALYMFSMAFHTVIHRIVQRAAHSSELKESIWRVFAELWQAALGLQFPADVLKVLRERDAALAAVTQKAQVDTGNNDEVEQRCWEMLGTTLQQKLAEQDLKSERMDLKGQVVMLTQAREELGKRVATVGKARDVAEQLAETRLKTVDETQSQLNQCHHTIERMRREMAQKNAIISDLAAQVSELTAAQDVHNDLVEEVQEELPARAPAQRALGDITAQRDALQATVDGHKKVVTMLQAQIASHKLKAEKSDHAHKQAAAALDVERSRTKNLTVESRRMEASVASFSRQLENERMHLSDMEAQANHELMRHRDLVKAYHPLVQRCQNAEAADKAGRAHCEELRAELQAARDQCGDLSQQLSASEDDNQQLRAVKQEHEELLVAHDKLKEDHVELTRHTRPLRVLIAFKRHEVSKLQMQLCNLLEVHADSSAFIRKTESQISDLEKQLETAGKDVEQKTVVIASLEQQVRELEAEKEKVQRRLDEAKIDDLHSEIQVLSSQLSERSQQLKDSQQSLAASSDELTREKGDNSALKVELQQAKDTLAATEQELSSTKDGWVGTKLCLSDSEKQVAGLVESLEAEKEQCEALHDRFDQQHNHQQELQAQIDALEEELQERVANFTKQHEGDIERAEAASQQRNQALEEVAQLTQSLSAVVEVQANDLQNQINRNATVRALGAQAVSVVQSAVNKALELGTAQDTALDEDCADENTSSTVISSLSATNDAAKRMLSMYAEIDLMRVAVDWATQQGNLNQEVQVLQGSLDQERAEQKRLQKLISAEQAKSAEIEKQFQHVETSCQAQLDQASAEAVAAQQRLRECQSDWSREKHSFQETISGAKEEAQELSTSLCTARELNTDLSKQCAEANRTILSQEATITDLQATGHAQVNEIESLGTAYAMKAQALEDTQAEKRAAEQTISDKESELVERGDEIATVKNDRAALEEELKKCNSSIVAHKKKIKRAEDALETQKEQERELQQELENMKMTWISAEDSRQLRQTARECQERELVLSQRVVTLSDDFCHLMERRDAVEAEMKQQQKWRRRVLALQQGLETALKSMCALEKRCCEVSESQQGLLSWASQNLSSTETMLEGFVACALEHDALLRRADMHAVHEAVLEATRITSQSKTYESSAKHAHRQLEHVQRLEQTISQLRHDLEKSRATVASKSHAVQEVQQTVQDLQKTNDDLRTEMKVCASSLEAHKSAFQEARELRGKVESQEQSIQSLVRRTLRLAAQLHVLQVCFFVRCNCTNSAPNLQQLMKKRARRAQDKQRTEQGEDQQAEQGMFDAALTRLAFVNQAQSPRTREEEAHTIAESECGQGVASVQQNDAQAVTAATSTAEADTTVEATEQIDAGSTHDGYAALGDAEAVSAPLGLNEEQTVDKRISGDRVEGSSAD